MVLHLPFCLGERWKIEFQGQKYIKDAEIPIVSKVNAGIIQILDEIILTFLHARRYIWRLF